VPQPFIETLALQATPKTFSSEAGPVRAKKTRQKDPKRFQAKWDPVRVKKTRQKDKR
jgi:hypothetical protein